jgi:hypothetical protein
MLDLDVNCAFSVGALTRRCQAKLRGFGLKISYYQVESNRHQIDAQAQDAVLADDGDLALVLLLADREHHGDFIELTASAHSELALIRLKSPKLNCSTAALCFQRTHPLSIAR